MASLLPSGSMWPFRFRAWSSPCARTQRHGAEILPMDSLRYLVEGAHVLRIKFKVASQFHHLLKIKTCCNAAMGHWGQSGVEMTEILVRLGGDLFAGAEVLFDGGDADFKLHPEQVVAGYEIRGGVQVGFRATGSVRPTQRRHQRMRRSFYSV